MSTATQAQHPSRSAKRCADCKHIKSSLNGDYCNHPAMPVSLVSGEPAVKARHARLSLTLTQLAQLTDPHCGPDGSLFEPAEGVDQVVLQRGAQGQGGAGLQVPGN